jgi:exodeoxyribonuclease III
VKPVKICTFNVNSIRARVDLLLQWLEKRGGDLDVLCLQELKAAEENFPFERFKALGYHSTVCSQPQYNGVAICSKTMPETVRKGLGDPAWDDQKRMISCKIDDLTVINVYIPRGDIRGEAKYHHKLEWYSCFREYLMIHHTPDEMLVVAGDFNVAMTDEDLYDPVLLHDTVGTMPEEREALKSLTDWGLADTYRHLYPDKAQFSWWGYQGGGIWKNEGMRIDYILCTEPMIGRLEEVEVDLWPRRRRKPTPSDHAPVITEFRS